MLSFSCHVLLLTVIDCYLPSNVQARLGRSFFSTRAKSCDVTSSHLSRALVSSTAARVFESRMPERRNEQGYYASSTAVRATGMQQGVANEGSTAVRSSSLLLSARHNVAIAIQLAQGHLPAKHNSILLTQPQQRGTSTQPSFHCDLQRLSCETQKNYKQRLHKLELQNRIPKPTHKNDDFDFEALFESF